MGPGRLWVWVSHQNIAWYFPTLSSHGVTLFQIFFDNITSECDTKRLHGISVTASLPTTTINNISLQMAYTGLSRGLKRLPEKLFQPESFVLLFSVLVQDREVSLCYLPRGQNYKSSLDGQSTFPVMMMMTMRACKEKGLLKRSVNDKYLWWTERPILASLNHLARKGDPWMETESECQTRVKVVMTWYQRNMAQSTNIKSSSSS